ncbi:nitroreductase/quinone reductase family protein [Streptomyces sp. NPDC088725]|uniref:nitroreductase/quinone reductase family protein n=1 Tax=Streptomyces sp. NPDC088725 TaxID=3365873 RepID=UPI0038225F59
MTTFNERIIAEFRANDGMVGGDLSGMHLILMHHTGRTTGLRRVTPVAYIRDGDDYVVCGSNAGGEKDPAWVANLAAMPETTIEVGDRILEVAPSVVTDPAERARLYAEVKRAYPGALDGYEEMTSRPFPLVRFTPAG